MWVGSGSASLWDTGWSGTLMVSVLEGKSKAEYIVTLKDFDWVVVDGALSHMALRAGYISSPPASLPCILSPPPPWSGCLRRTTCWNTDAWNLQRSEWNIRTGFVESLRLSDCQHWKMKVYGSIWHHCDFIHVDHQEKDPTSFWKGSLPVVNKTVSQVSLTMGQLYEKEKGEDRFLHVAYYRENTFCL